MDTHIHRNHVGTRRAQVHAMHAQCIRPGAVDGVHRENAEPLHLPSTTTGYEALLAPFGYAYNSQAKLVRGTWAPIKVPC